MGGLLGIVLILGGFEGHHVGERTQFHGCHNSHTQWLHISRVALSQTLARVYVQGWFVSLSYLASGVGRVGSGETQCHLCGV